MPLKKSELAEALRKKMGKLKQEAYAAKLSQCGEPVHQATISRLLNERCKTVTPKLARVCRYAGIPLDRYVRKTHPQKSRRLMRALGTVWDGSKDHEAWLARVIKTAGANPN